MRNNEQQLDHRCYISIVTIKLDSKTYRLIKTLSLMGGRKKYQHEFPIKCYLQNITEMECQMHEQVLLLYNHLRIFFLP